jgi:hypothetical protein
MGVTEQQAWTLVRSYPGFELRRYEPHLLAEVAVGGSFEQAGNRAFGSLARYIGGRNRQQRNLAMTAPVLQRSEADRHVVSFVMPAGETAASVPAPSDPAVAVREVPAETAAVVRYTGRWTESGYHDRLARLRADVDAAGLEVAGPARWARFDPPWTPWFLRHNEIVLPVHEAAAR